MRVHLPDADNKVAFVLLFLSDLGSGTSGTLAIFGSNKQLRATSGVAPGIDINTFGNTMPPLPGSHGVRDPLLMVWLVQVLFLEVWAVLGQVFTNDKAFRLLP